MTLQTTDSRVLRASKESKITCLTVSAIRTEAADVVSLFLQDPHERMLPAWEPGAHIEVRFGNGLLRQYSLCSDPAERHEWRIAVLREPSSRGGSLYVHERVKAGDALEIRGPRYNFRGTSASGENVFIAGGIGITPLLPMILERHARQEAWRLLYLGSDLGAMAFLDEITALDPDSHRVQIHAKRQSGALNLGQYLRAAQLGDDSTVYACGPQRMLAELRSAHTTGLIPHLMYEDFGSNNGGVAEPCISAAGGGSAFVVQTADGTEVQVAATETILDALQREGIPALSSCRKGTCGTCETGVLEGSPDHRDTILSDQERASNTTMMICVSRCLGDRLVLDI